MSYLTHVFAAIAILMADQADARIGTEGQSEMVLTPKSLLELKMGDGNAATPASPEADCGVYAAEGMLGNDDLSDDDKPIAFKHTHANPCCDQFDGDHKVAEGNNEGCNTWGHDGKLEAESYCQMFIRDGETRDVTFPLRDHGPEGGAKIEGTNGLLDACCDEYDWDRKEGGHAAGKFCNASNPDADECKALDNECKEAGCTKFTWNRKSEGLVGDCEP